MKRVQNQDPTYINATNFLKGIAIIFVVLEHYIARFFAKSLVLGEVGNEFVAIFFIV